ncbi:putative RNase H-like nuclease [Haloactinopolyspora alba]|uniref:Putative RNase H-like nuclease n=1 Tax=Haloactinopolyspora alba TaxID=648780 RepID=A0A2P8EG85_9ACTN|nr:DUF429 domain-containing protein [Haloactinopolyspora alba]PSL08470.1 putative RNase H-like nuclease [Haloactinopolyspora alba]
MTDHVLGVDACRAGWVGISLVGDDVRGWFATTIADLVHNVSADGRPRVVAIDIPIGLPTNGPREADRLARELLGPRRSAVFTTLVRAAYEAIDFRAANQAQVAATSKGTTQQGWALRHKVLEVDRWLDKGGPDTGGDDETTVVECHPEVSFAAMNGDSPVSAPKKTWSGHYQRRELLAANAVVVPDELGDAGRRAGMDDVLDAAAAAWTARRVARGEAASIPETPERFGNRLAAIVC